MVYRVCWRVLQHTEDTEDAFQATFLILAVKLRTVRKHASLASWLHGVAHRVAVKSKLQTAGRRRRESRAALAEAMPTEDLTWHELRLALDAELRQLPDKLRLPLILCYLESRTQDEAASQLGWSKSTLRRRLERARDQLAHRLRGRGIVLSGASSAVLVSDCVASVAPELVAAAVEASLKVTSGERVAAVATPAVAALTEGVMKAMLWKKLQTGIAVLLVVMALGIGLGLRGFPGHAQTPSAPVQPKEPVSKALVQPKVSTGKRAPQQEVRTDKELLQGKWDITEVVSDGMATDNLKDVQAVFEKERFSLVGPAGKREFRFKLDPAKKPKAIDLAALDGEFKDKSARAIYHLEGDSLRLCMPNEITDNRPTEFVSKEGSKLLLMTLKRSADKEQKNPLDPQAEARRLNGTWVVTDDGGENPVRPTGHERGSRWIIDQGSITFGHELEQKEADRVGRYFRVDPTKDPKTIVISITPKRAWIGSPVFVEYGIYALDGDRLKLYIDGLGKDKLPTAFPPKSITAQYRTLVLERQRPIGAAKDREP
jgi:RNA polymerase sigma factor (sigma-70 family)